MGPRRFFVSCLIGALGFVACGVEGDGEGEVIDEISAEARSTEVVRGYRLPYRPGTARPVWQYPHAYRDQIWNAIDIGLARGSDVLAMKSGTVSAVVDTFPDLPSEQDCLQRSCNDATNFVIIQHDDGQESSYLHVARGSVTAAGLRPGARVCQGQVIAKIGHNGYTSGPHLHVSVQAGGSRGARNAAWGAMWSKPTKVIHFEEVGGTLRQGASFTSQNTTSCAAPSPQAPDPSPPPSGATRDASFTRLVLPSILPEGAAATVEIRVKNTGTATWMPDERYRLAVVSPNEAIWSFEGSSSPDPDAKGSGGYFIAANDARVFLPSAVAPGATVKLRARIAAPKSRPRTDKVTLAVQMIQDGISRFGSTVVRDVTVCTPGTAGCTAIDAGAPDDEPAGSVVDEEDLPSDDPSGTDHASAPSSSAGERVGDDDGEGEGEGPGSSLAGRPLPRGGTGENQGCAAGARAPSASTAWLGALALLLFGQRARRHRAGSPSRGSGGRRPARGDHEAGRGRSAHAREDHR